MQTHLQAALLAIHPTKKEIAKIIGVSEKTLYNYLNGASQPRTRVLLRFPQLIEAMQRDADPPSYPAKVAQMS